MNDKISSSKGDFFMAKAEHVEAQNKISTFFRTILPFVGCEIGIPSNMFFCINQICEEGTPENEYRYSVQYGFPQSGSVVMNFGYNGKTRQFSIDKISVYAAPKEETQPVVANFSPRTQVGPMSIKVNFGMDMNTVAHESLSSIEGNKNALGMLDMAISDLSKAKILGECRMCAPEGSTHIPCCDCHQIEPEEDKTTEKRNHLK